MLVEIGSKPIVGASLPVPPGRDDLCLLSFHHPLSQVLPAFLFHSYTMIAVCNCDPVLMHRLLPLPTPCWPLLAQVFLSRLGGTTCAYPFPFLLLPLVFLSRLGGTTCAFPFPFLLLPQVFLSRLGGKTCAFPFPCWRKYSCPALVGCLVPIL